MPWAYRGALFKLYQEGTATSVRALKARGRDQSVAFSLRSGGSYRCQYGSSLLSDTVHISKEEFPKPLISVQPAREILKGENFAIGCQCHYPGVRFSLYKGRILIEELDSAEHPPAVAFHIQNASLRDRGRYRCYYRTLVQPVLWSEASDVLRVDVKDISHAPTVNCSATVGSLPEPHAKLKAIVANLTMSSLDLEEKYNCSFREEESDLYSDMGLTGAEASSQGWRSDFTEENIARMGLAAVVLVLALGLVVHACYCDGSRKVQGEESEVGSRLA